jgi:hypothetical protein
MERIAKPIADMQKRGWTVTFPAFGQTRAFIVRATKGDQQWQRGYTNGEEMADALTRLNDYTNPETSSLLYDKDAWEMDKRLGD